MEIIFFGLPIFLTLEVLLRLCIIKFEFKNYMNLFADFFTLLALVIVDILSKFHELSSFEENLLEFIYLTRFVRIGFSICNIP